MITLRDYLTFLPMSSLFLIAGVLLSIAKKIGNLILLRKLVHLLKVVLSFIALCEKELDLISEAEIDLCAICTDELQPLVIYPKD